MLFPPNQRHQAATRNVLLGLGSPLESYGVLLAQLKAGSQAGKVPTEFWPNGYGPIPMLLLLLLLLWLWLWL